MYLTFDVKHLSNAVSLGILRGQELSEVELWIAIDAGISEVKYIKVMLVYMYNRLKLEESLYVLISLWSIDSLIAHSRRNLL